MLGIPVQSFLSASSGIALLLALIGGFARRGAQTADNLWVDLTRSTLYTLLPFSLLFAVVFMGQDDARPARARCKHTASCLWVCLSGRLPWLHP
jgi:K+-transporting ATPase A subunit